MVDGSSNTIMFMERYHVCSNIGNYWLEWDNSQDGILYVPMWPNWPVGGINPAYAMLPPSYSGQNNLPVPQPKPSLSTSAPPSNQCNQQLAQGFSTAGCMVGLGDGSVRMVSAQISPQTWSYALFPSDGQVLGSDW